MKLSDIRWQREGDRMFSPLLIGINGEADVVMINRYDDDVMRILQETTPWEIVFIRGQRPWRRKMLDIVELTCLLHLYKVLWPMSDHQPIPDFLISAGRANWIEQLYRRPSSS